MQRKARPRSGSPRLIVAFGTTHTIFGTTGGIDRITTSLVVVGNRGTVAVITGSITLDAGVGISASIGDGADGASASPWTTR